jgi:hypothetical protein
MTFLTVCLHHVTCSEQHSKTQAKTLKYRYIHTYLRDGENMAGIIGAIWGITGVLLLLGSAAYRLTPLAFAAFSVPFAWYQWLAWVLSLLFIAHAEGYRGFQMHFFATGGRPGTLSARTSQASASNLCSAFLYGLFPCNAAATGRFSFPHGRDHRSHYHRPSLAAALAGNH